MGIGQNEESLEAIRQCLRLDSDDKSCKPHYTLVKKLTKQFNEIQKLVDGKRWNECVVKAKLSLQTESTVHAFVVRSKSHLCRCYRKSEQTADALKIHADLADARRGAERGSAPRSRGSAPAGGRL